MLLLSKERRDVAEDSASRSPLFQRCVQSLLGKKKTKTISNRICSNRGQNKRSPQRKCKRWKLTASRCGPRTLFHGEA